MIEIKKAKIKDGMFLEAEYSERQPDGTSNSVKISSEHVIHDDLRAAFNDLNETLAQFTEQYERDMNVLGDVKLSGFVIAGNGDSEGVTMIGLRYLESGKTLNIISPFASWIDHDIQESIGLCRQEVYQYLFEDKHQPSDQLELEFNETVENHDQDSENPNEEKPAKKTKRKAKAKGENVINIDF